MKELSIFMWIVYSIAVLYFATGFISNIINIFNFFKKDEKEIDKKKLQE